MDIFVRNLPVSATSKQLDDFFRTPLQNCGARVFHAEKFKGRPLGILTVLDLSAAQRFLSWYGVAMNAPRHVQAMHPLYWGGGLVLCTKSKTSPSDFALRSLKYEASRPDAPNRKATSNAQPKEKVTTFPFKRLSCGVWDYADKKLAFTSHFVDERQGSVTFGRKGVLIMLGTTAAGRCRIELDYFDCDNITFAGSSDPSVSFTLLHPPKFYEEPPEEDPLSAMLFLTLGSDSRRMTPPKKIRLPSIDSAHAKVAGNSFVYRVWLLDPGLLNTVRGLLKRNVRGPTTLALSTRSILPMRSLEADLAYFNRALSQIARDGILTFSLLFQADRLARNGALPPRIVRKLLPKVLSTYVKHGQDATASALRKFYRQLPVPSSAVESEDLSLVSLEAMLEEFATAYESYQYNADDPYELVKRHAHVKLIHRVVVTPAGIYLEGPEPEPTNRVLRRYGDHTDHFVRVVFQDEDGSSVRYDPRADQEQIFHGRFKHVLDGSLTIAGRGFQFLGFSHSSLRSKSCWFMAPMVIDGQLKIPEMILQDLGDFVGIRVPAKCAARIGQNFGDTNATVDVRSTEMSEMPNVERNGRDFSDGVGTISRELLQDVWKVYGTKRMLKPTALQIRFQGCKGMVALDSRISGRQLRTRPNMKKFETAAGLKINNLEICGAGFKPLPMVLNRQFIKILEDLHVPTRAFLDLQNAAVERLSQRTDSAINTAHLLEELEISKGTGVPHLIRKMEQIGIDYHEDHFLHGIVEMAVANRLQEIKYRGRIPVDQGVTLYGIMDETGYLRENEIFVVTESPPEGGREVLVRSSVVITRAPALHPGDVQIVNAVDVPRDSPLRKLSNVIVFSQHGERDIPSKLSGGDLDGDLYNCVWDPTLIPKVTYTPADYPKVSAVALDRPVTRKDMSDFFVTFMESDQLGLLSNIHLQLADQREAGTIDSDCIKIAGLASVAVDFSKSGIPVNMRECPKYDRCRPDFMAPSPRMVVSEQGHLAVQEDDYDDDPAFEGMDVERRGWQYYESHKALGHLYRAIDERQFLDRMQQDHSRAKAHSQASSDLPTTLLRYMKRVATAYGIEYVHHTELATNIRTCYEESLLDTIYQYEPSPKMPLTETEVFAGTILGRTGGAQGKALRELSTTMRDRFQAIVEYAVMRVVRGDEQMQGVADLDALYPDVNLDREVEALPRAIACLDVAVRSGGFVDRRVGELKSFRYVAANVCLRELEHYRTSTFGSYTLPRVSSI